MDKDYRSLEAKQDQLELAIEKKQQAGPWLSTINRRRAGRISVACPLAAGYIINAISILHFL